MPNESENNEKEVEETVEEETQEETTEAQDESQEGSEEESTEESADSSSTEEKIDYKAIAAAEKERADKLQNKLAGNAFKKRQEKRIEPEEVEETEDDLDRPMTVAEYERRREQDRLDALKESRESEARRLIEAGTTSSEEAEAVYQFYRGRISPSDDLQTDIEIAIAGVNRKSLIGKNKELARALKGKNSAQTVAPGGTQRDPLQGPAKKMPADLNASLERSGFVYDSKNKHWAKKMPNGNLLIKKDAKSPVQLLEVK